jgi:hypothetical protein
MKAASALCGKSLEEQQAIFSSRFQAERLGVR